MRFLNSASCSFVGCGGFAGRGSAPASGTTAGAALVAIAEPALGGSCGFVPHPKTSTATRQSRIARCNTPSMDLFARLSSYDYGELHMKLDKATQLRAIVAIHDSRLGPALRRC